MFRSIKKRVKSIGEGNRNRKHTGSSSSHTTNETTVVLDTPRRTVSAPLLSPASSTASSTKNSSSVPGPSPMSRRFGSDRNHDRFDDTELVSKIPYLSSFDKCIETSDAIIASSSSSGKSETVLKNRTDEATGLPDCSLLVSPDGELLLIPTNEKPELIFQNMRAEKIAQHRKRTNRSHSNDSMNTSSNNKAKVINNGTNNKQSDTQMKDTSTAKSTKTVTKTDDTTTSTNKEVHPSITTSEQVDVNKDDKDDVKTVGESDDDDDDDVGLNEIPSNSFSELMLHGKDDYESAVFIGDDLRGDKQRNRFTARGWSVPATTLALQQTGHSLDALAHFCEQMVLSRKESAARTTIACDNLKNETDSRQYDFSMTEWEIIDPRATDFEFSNDRVGPFQAETSTLRTAVNAVEQYHNVVAEKESRRWRMASLQRKGVLPLMHTATDLFHGRSSKRQRALQESSRRARVMEDRLRKLKDIAASRWDAVYKAEDRVTKKVEQLMMERSKERQKARLRLLQEQQEQKSTEDVTQGSNMTEEVWNMVSSVAESMDHGSFEPMAIPAGNNADAASAMSDDISTTSSITQDMSENVLPLANREEVEKEMNLPELRAAAMRADDDVQEASDTLLNILSTLDTIRRSARVAAETCLVSAGNAQAACLRSMIELERESLEERLRDLDSVEESLDNIDIRADLDMYISKDKKSRGGTSHLGDDDDGGIASALATLSSHVDGNNNNNHRNDNNNHDLSDPTQIMTENSEKHKMTSTAKLTEAIDKLLEKNDNLNPDNNDNDDEKIITAKEEYENNVEFLCSAAKGLSSASKARRSAICYTLNSKRGANAKILTPIQFDGVCRLFDAILTGCIEEGGGVSNAKMCMMLAQTFFIESEDSGTCTDDGTDDSAAAVGTKAGGATTTTRKRRLYIKNKLMNHPIWSKDDFWDVALSQQISESLTHSGVMSNFERGGGRGTIRRPGEWAQTKRTRWYDLNYTERIEAASQVHAVVFAQLGALAHSMIELGCGLERSCAFVRRMSIRNQLPSSHRTMLLTHLMDRDDVERRESSEAGKKVIATEK